MKPVDVKTEILISSPIESVADYASNPDNAPEWYVNIRSAEWKTKKPLEMGSLIAFKAKFMGKELSYTYEVVEFLPRKKLVMRTVNGPFPMETTYKWKSRNGQTYMSLRNAGAPSGFSKLFAPLMKVAMKKANLKDLKKLKEILESES